MISTSDFKKGTRFELDGEPWTVLDVSSQSPTARGSNTLIKTKVRNLITGSFAQKTFKAGEKFSEPDLELKVATYLYSDDDYSYFMDSETYEQHQLTPDELGDARSYLTEELEVKVQLFNDRPIGVEVPSTLILKIVETEPAVRGDTVNAVTKAATLETGLIVQVPMFVESGENIRVDTREARYLERAKTR